jgi:hypothetical protein
VYTWLVSAPAFHCPEVSHSRAVNAAQRLATTAPPIATATAAAAARLQTHFMQHAVTLCQLDALSSVTLPHCVHNKGKRQCKHCARLNHGCSKRLDYETLLEPSLIKDPGGQG